MLKKKKNAHAVLSHTIKVDGDHQLSSSKKKRT